MEYGEPVQPQPDNTQEASRLPDNLESKYLEMRPAIINLYRNVWLWHGTGRFDDNGATDVLKGICDTKEISLHQDSWDATLRDIETISATEIRPYAAFYSDMHLWPNTDELLYKDSRTINLAKQRRLPTLLGFLRHPFYLSGQIKKVGPAWIERKTGQAVEDKKIWNAMKQFFRGKLRSNIPDDYPVLIGLARNAFKPIKTAGYLSTTEVRSNKPIPIDKITHIEVPLKYMEQTEVLLHEKGVSILVLPREFGERYSSEFSVKELLKGSCFQKKE